MAAQAIEEVKIVTIDDQVVAQLYNDFIIYLTDVLQKSTASQHLKLARVSFEAPKTIIIWCASEINKVMVSTQKDLFFDFVKKETRQPDVRIQIEVDEQVVSSTPITPVARTTATIYEEMVIKQPLLQTLRQQLNLTIK